MLQSIIYTQKGRISLVQTELSKPARQVETLPLRKLHGRTSPTTPPTLAPRTKLS